MISLLNFAVLAEVRDAPERCSIEERFIQGNLNERSARAASSREYESVQTFSASFVVQFCPVFLLKSQAINGFKKQYPRVSCSHSWWGI